MSEVKSDYKKKRYEKAAMEMSAFEEDFIPTKNRLLVQMDAEKLQKQAGGGLIVPAGIDAKPYLKGTVLKTGEEVNGYKPGDRVYVRSGSGGMLLEKYVIGEDEVTKSSIYVVYALYYDTEILAKAKN